MANYKPDYSHQNQFIAVDFSAQIVPGTFEYALSHIIDNHLDLSSFNARYKNDKGGASAYSPAIMLKIILQAQAWGSVGEQQTLQPAIKQLQKTLSKIQQADSLIRLKSERSVPIKATNSLPTMSSHSTKQT
nr:hypothetical protein [Catenovulum sediminis]